jgi:hypothetical protein
MPEGGWSGRQLPIHPIRLLPRQKIRKKKRKSSKNRFVESLTLPKKTYDERPSENPKTENQVRTEGSGVESVEKDGG